MNARDRLRTCLKVAGWEDIDADILLDGFAHELAEEIRAMVFGRDDLDYEEKWLAYEAADLIDPKAEK